MDEMRWARELVPGIVQERSLEAALMDWADDVAYAVHDLEDFFRAGLIPLDRLVTDEAERDRFLSSELVRQGGEGEGETEALEDAFTRVLEAAPVSAPYRGTHRDRASLRSFTSYLINRYIRSVSLAPDGVGERALQIEPVARQEVAMLKGLTWQYVINSRSLATQRFGQRALVRSLFNVFAEAVFEPKDWFIFPAYYQEILHAEATHEEKLRIVADVISSMSEAQAVDVHQQLVGQRLGSAMDHPVL